MVPGIDDEDDDDAKKPLHLSKKKIEGSTSSRDVVAKKGGAF